MCEIPRSNEKSICGIYSIKFFDERSWRVAYVGSSVNIRKRWKEHSRDLRRGEHCNTHLQNVWDKYTGKIEFGVLEAPINRCDLPEREQFWIDKLDPECNIALIPNLGQRWDLSNLPSENETPRWNPYKKAMTSEEFSYGWFDENGRHKLDRFSPDELYAGTYILAD